MVGEGKYGMWGFLEGEGVFLANVRFAGFVLGRGYIVVLNLTSTEELDLSLFSLVFLVGIKIWIFFGVGLMGEWRVFLG